MCTNILRLWAIPNLIKFDFKVTGIKYNGASVSIV